MRTTIITNLILPAELRSCGQLMIFVFFVGTKIKILVMLL